MAAADLSRQQGLNILGDTGSGIKPTVSANNIAIAINQELLEVPRDVSSGHRAPQGHSCLVKAASGQNECMVVVTAQTLGVAHWVHGHGCCLTHPLEEGVRSSAIHMHFGHDLKFGFKAIAGADIFQHVKSLRVILVALVAKLVAVEAKHAHLVPELLRNVILRKRNKEKSGME